MRGTHFAALTCLSALAACATSNTVPDKSPPQTQSVSVSGMAGTLKISPSASSSTTNLGYPIDQVWKVLPVVMDSAAVPIATMEPARHLIGNSGWKLRQRLGKVLLSRYVDCGTTQIGPNADSYEVVLTVYVQLQAGANNTTNVTTSIDANAKPVSFNQAYSACSSKGQLESRLLDLIKANVAH